MSVTGKSIAALLRRIVATSAWSLATLAAPLGADQTLLFDDFDAAQLDSATWGLATWNIGDRTQFGNQPTFSGDGAESWISLPLDTWNPNLPGERVFGTEIYSLQNFELGGGVEYLARARLNTDMPGLVAAFFTYNQKRQKGRWISDEIDFEILSKQDFDRLLVTSWDDWGAAGANYDDGVHHLGALLALPGVDWRQWNTYAIRWYPDRVEWLVNGELVHLQARPVPDQPQPIRASLWAGGTTWPDAYDPLLQPTANPAANQRFSWDLDYILVTALGGDVGGGQAPTPPSDLSAAVNSSNVTLAWSDNSIDETGFNIYRAWKPKGKASPDFQAVAVLPAGTTAFVHAPGDGDHLYRVTASNAAGESPPSNIASVRVGSVKGGNPNREGN